MTVSSTTAKIQYSGNGTTTSFAVPWYFLANGDLQVILRSSAGVETVQTLGTNYTVTGAGSTAGGTVLMTTAPATGTTLTIVRNVSLTQETDFLPNDRLPAESLEQTVDKLTMIVQQLDERMDRSLVAPVTDSGTLSNIPNATNRAEKYLGFDASGNPTVASGPATPYNSVDVSYVRAETGAVVRNVRDRLRDLVSVKDFGATGDGTTTDTAFVQAAITALTSGGTIYFPKGTYKCGALTVGNANITLLLDAGAVLSFPTLGSGVKAITVNANNFAIEGGKLQGPAASVYIPNENGIHMIGTSTSVRKSGLRLVDVEITQFGGHGIYAQFVDNILLDSCKIHYCGYSGASFLSCNHGVATKNQFLNITPGTVGNMYGITLTHDSTGYSSDPNAGTKLAANPFCWDWYIGHNYAAYNAWEPIDCHGGYEITIDSNKVYASYGGIACSSSSGGAAAYAGANNVITNNVVDARNPDGSASGYENDNYGINLNGGSTLNHKNVVCKGNVVIGHGILGNTNSGAIQAVYVQNGTISDNVIQKWGGAGIVATASSSMIISKNTFLELGGAAAGAENAIMIETTSALGNTFTITDNSMQANGGTAGLVGVRAPQLTTLPYFAGNDFAAASSTAYVVPNDFLVSDVSSPLYRVTVNNAGGGAAVNVDVAALSRYRTFRIDVTSSNAASEISNFSNGVYGQVIHIHSPSATAFVLNATAKRLAGGSAFTASQYDIISFLQTGDVSGVGGVYWTEISRSVNA